MSYSQPHVLLVDDDTSLCQLLAEYLAGEGFSVSALHSGEALLAHVQNEAAQGPQCIVLDIMMPGMMGLDALQHLRKFSDVPVIMLTGRGDDVDRIIGLELGADDYLGKPCNPRELAARIKAILRRASTETPPAEHVTATLQLHGICLDSQTREVQLHGEALSLTAAEFNVLRLLMASAGESLTKAYLTEQVLHRKLSAYDRSIDVHVSRLRQKLAKQGGLHDIIKTIRGSGYQMVKPA